MIADQLSWSGSGEWWSIDDPEERAREAFGYAQQLEQNLRAAQVSADTRAIALYEGDTREDDQDGQTVTNAIQNTVDVFVGDVTKERIRLQFLTEHGNYEEREQAQEMSRAIEGQLFESGLYGVDGTEVCRDGFVCPSGGAIKTTCDWTGKRVLNERIRASRIFYDPRDARLGHPRSMCYVDDYAPEVIKARYPKVADELESVCPVAWNEIQEEEGIVWDSLRVPKRIKVYELWHLPSCDVQSEQDEAWGIGGAKPSHDGRYIMLAGPGQNGPVVLADRPWPIQLFPVTHFLPWRRMRGLRGHSLAERLRRLQLQVDRYQKRIDGMMTLFSRVIVYTWSKSGIRPNQVLSNDYSRVFEGDVPAHEAIAHITPQTVPPELINRVAQLLDHAKEYTGQTDLSMRGAKPPGIEAGVALNTLLDQHAIRHTPVYRAWGEAFRNVALVNIEMFRLMSAVDSGFSVNWGTDDGLRTVKWRQIDLDRQRFKVRVWETNLFSSSPAAKLQQVLELFKTGGLPTERLLQVLITQFPDIGALFGDENAPQAACERKISDVVQSRKIEGRSVPNKINNLPLLLELAAIRYNALEADHAPDEVLLALSGLMELVKDVQSQSASPTVTAPMSPPEGAASGAAMPPPSMTGAPAPAPAQQGQL